MVSAVSAHAGAARSARQSQAFIYFLVLPAVVLRFGFTVVPLAQTAWLSLTDKTLYRPGTWVGLANFVSMLTDYQVTSSISFTLIFTVASTLLELLVGLGIALLINQNLRGQWLWRMVVLLPWAVAPLVAGIMFRLMLFEAGGVVNDLVLRLHLSPTRMMWLSDPMLARVSVIVNDVWRNAPWAALILLGGLTSIPKDLYEAAETDGAGSFARFRHITLPLLVPSALVILMMRGMGTMQAFDQIIGLTRGGPGSATRIISLYTYEEFFMNGVYGYGSALAVVLLVATAAIGGAMALLLFRAQERY